MNEFQLFDFENHKVRALSLNGKAYFVGKDVAAVLGYAKTANAINKHVDVEDKGVTKMMTPGGRQNIQIINESGVYSLIFSSKLPNAKKFKHWVTSEVLPTIRKHGAYMTDEKIEEVLTDPDTIIKLATQLKDERQQRLIEQQLRKDAENQVHEMKPKALFADSVATSKSTILIGELAKILRGNGVDIGATRLFKWMRANGYLISRKGSDWNMPTQRAMNLGLFKIKETTINHSNGSTSISKTPKVTGKGQQYFVNKFLKKQAPKIVADKSGIKAEYQNGNIIGAINSDGSGYIA
ncbi:phage antirepressor [Lactobacillus crispatus]|uniref:phage antirepressor n=1 Tax=Lactobacillus crispatus TaxID=47770 RepID=UPI0022AC4615|nr:phage antirepressor [Lactobacillus crispatus]MCZ3847156.1 phage antirepressor [Lactobacillus crispatus]MCZ3849418.1 phage antirepressor [Lactobacillus crispatus]MCZ3855354.1 phage antirepressor [Lactobacillus crispatus]MCZ3857537.1 phage antirepressor [Lactobacillus crispatus]MCZ3859901.1 phage antirepressor [Lactobacillus crispatus]